MRYVRSAIRTALLEFAQAVRRMPRDRTIVLLYHRVQPSPAPHDIWSISTERFAEHLDVLSATRFADVPLDALAAARVLGGRRVLIAFDDGYRAPVEHALSALKSAGRTAAFFLVAGAMGASSEWERAFGLAASPVMSWDDARGLLAEGMAIGSHSMTHADLSILDDRALEEEVIASKRRIDEELGVSVGTFSVPFGRDDARLDPVLRAAGYRAKLTNPAAAARARDVVAYGVSGVLQDDDPRRLRMHLSGAYDVLRHYHRVRGALLGRPRA